MMQYQGKVVRTVPTMGLAYLAETSTGRVIGFSLSQLESYAGESFAEAGVKAGATFYFEASSDGRLTSISREPHRRAAGAGA